MEAGGFRGGFLFHMQGSRFIERGPAAGGLRGADKKELSRSDVLQHIREIRRAPV